MSALPRPTTPHARRRPPGPAAVRTLLTALLAVVALLVALPGTARAAGDGFAPPRPGHPDRDWMGSTVRLHEGGEPVVEPERLTATVEGVDVSSHNGNVAWSTLWNSGARFAYVKATEGTGYTNPYFAQQYNGSYNVGMLRGSYHFALPDHADGAAQANYFADHGGGWSADGRTLPGVLDMEYNPYGDICYGMSTGALVDWMTDFFRTYRQRTGRDAVLYTSTAWWQRCTGDYAGFGAVNPLWIPRYAGSPGTLPAGWSFHTFWQYTDTGPVVGDHNRFNGSQSRLQALADG
ncbi:MULTISPECIES: lysozyme [Streptomyces]|uniref:lysozyme n=1 Tax=Streptomyces TaxID=1883 RepID=UPI00163C83C5|nr:MULTISPECIES: lysozyme [Streptomyces]MBC2873510.1 lysozyme [Streptomyces sp. TYQ1024]UBI36813.1 lysozyme [Streptomyces mobaraensis]UKW29405.1 lysozyme [Streptomyces sp. TYQ1024]